MNIKSITNATNVANSSKAKASSSKSSFKSYLGESEELDAIFQKASKKYGVDVNLLKAIAKAESDFNPNSTSHCGAMGIMQLMPGTAKGLGVKNAYDPEQCIMGGAKLISGLLEKYDGDIPLALAGYNAGTGNVRKYGGIPPFKETQNYIKKVTKYMGSGSTTGATVITHSSSTSKKNPSSSTSAAVEAAAVNKTVIPSGLQLKRMAEEKQGTNASSVNSSSSILEQLGYTSTDQISAALRKLEATGEVSDTKEARDVFSYEQYLKFVDLFYVQDESKTADQNDESKSDAEKARLQMSASISTMLRNL